MFEKFFRNYFCLLSALDLRCGKHTLLWTFYLKYKAFVDFPLSLILPLVVWLFKRQKDFNYQEKTKEKTQKDKEGRKNIAKYKEDKKTEENSVAKYKEDKEVKENSIVKYRNNKQVKYFAGITLLIFLPNSFFLNWLPAPYRCRRKKLYLIHVRRLFL